MAIIQRLLWLRRRSGHREVVHRKTLVSRRELSRCRSALGLPVGFGRRRLCTPRRSWLRLRSIDTSLRSDFSLRSERGQRPDDTGAEQQKRDDQRPPWTRARGGLGRHQAQATELAFPVPIQWELVRLANPDRFHHLPASLPRPADGISADSAVFRYCTTRQRAAPTLSSLLSSAHSSSKESPAASSSTVT